MYEIAISRVERISQYSNKYLRKWLGVPPCFSKVGLYTNSGNLQLPISSLVEEFKIGKVRHHMMMKDSADEIIRKAYPEIKSGTKWSAVKTAKEAECSLCIKDIIGVTQTNRAVLGSTRKKVFSKVDAKGKRNDLLPNATNLRLWAYTNLNLCLSCKSDRGTLRHVLFACPQSLQMYIWWHKKVLEVIIELLRDSKPAIYIRQGTHNSVSQGRWMSCEETKNPNMKLLNGASDWKVSADLKTSLQFPVQIIQTEKRPDIVAWSDSKKSVLLIELTVPWEENREEAHERKKNGCETLRADCVEKGSICHVIPIEVGCRGFIGHSVISFLSKIGITGRSLKVASNRLQTMAQYASSWIWSKARTFSAWRKYTRNHHSHVIT